MKGYSLLLFISFIGLSLSIDPESPIYKTIQSFSAEYPAIKEDIEHPKNYDETLKPIVQSGMAQYKENVAITSYNGVQPDSVEPFLDYIFESFSIPDKFKTEMRKAIDAVKEVKQGEIVSANCVFSVEETSDECKYFNIVGQRNTKNEYEFLVGDVQSTFKLEEDSIGIKTNKALDWDGLKEDSTKAAAVKPAKLSDEELEKLFNYFQTQVFKGIAELYDIKKTLKVD